MNYLTYKHLNLVLDTEELSFTLCYAQDAQSFVLLRDARLKCLDAAGHPVPLSRPEISELVGADVTGWRLSYSSGLSIRIALGDKGFSLECTPPVRLGFEAALFPNEEPDELLSMRLGAPGSCLQLASGPAIAPTHNALYHRQLDLALEYADTSTLRFDWETGRYVLGMACPAALTPHPHSCHRKYEIPYRGIRKRPGFRTPSVGWMTWYAVKFKASEQVVLENASAFMKQFGDYNDARPVLWVDWEWCHEDLKGKGCQHGDMLHPRKDAYPHGLKWLARQLEDLGFLPALWVGPTNDGQLNSIMLKHPEWVLAQRPNWSGQYWFDLTHPQVLSRLLPRLFRQYLSWGFQALKWDVIPNTFMVLSEFRDKACAPSVTPLQAVRNAAAIARKTIGESVYMMSCCGYNENDITGAMDTFDGARIGGDIFSWKDFLNEGIGRILRYIPLHNTAFYIDADNLVLREEYSTLPQARTRVSVYGICGLPVTLGDALDALDEPRIQMLRSIMPVLPIHPASLERHSLGQDLQLIRLDIARPFGQWSLAAIINLTDTPRHATLSLAKDLNLPCSPTAAFDYWNQCFLGVTSDVLELDIQPYDTVLLRLTPLAPPQIPTLLSVSRHITQGGYELLDYLASPTQVSGTLHLPPNAPCRVSLLLPKGSSVKSTSHPASQEGSVLTLHVSSPTKTDVRWNAVLGLE